MHIEPVTGFSRYGLQALEHAVALARAERTVVKPRHVLLGCLSDPTWPLIREWTEQTGVSYAKIHLAHRAPALSPSAEPALVRFSGEVRQAVQYAARIVRRDRTLICAVHLIAGLPERHFWLVEEDLIKLGLTSEQFDVLLDLLPGYLEAYRIRSEPDGPGLLAHFEITETYRLLQEVQQLEQELRQLLRWIQTMPVRVGQEDWTALWAHSQTTVLPFMSGQFPGDCWELFTQLVLTGGEIWEQLPAVPQVTPLVAPTEPDFGETRFLENLPSIADERRRAVAGITIAVALHNRLTMGHWIDGETIPALRTILATTVELLSVVHGHVATRYRELTAAWVA